MVLAKKKLLMNFSFAAQFNYYSLVWMIYSRFNNSRGKYLHETCPRVTYSDKISLHEELLDEDESDSIHQWGILG